MAKPVLFFSRCKPWSVDFQDFAIEHNWVFFGYFLKRPGSAYNPAEPLSYLVSPGCDQDEWNLHHKDAGKDRAQFSKNRNLVNAVGEGSVVLVPRPSAGVIYAGKLSSPFKIAHSDERWAQAQKLFGAAGYDDSDEYRLAGEIVQGWEVEEFIALPIPTVPANIRHSLFGRSTYGIVHPRDGEREDPLGTILTLMERRKAGGAFTPLEWTTDLATVRSRIVSNIIPSQLETLVVSLLQLDQPQLSWIGVGGSGDGGVDGLAADAHGDVVGLLQCKWRYEGGHILPVSKVWDGGGKSIARYLAYVTSWTKPPAGSYTVLDLDWIAAKMVEHSDRLPAAMTLRVGTGQ